MKEDFKDIVRLLPQHTKLPASKKMMYLVARLELRPATSIQERLALVNAEGASMADAIGPAVGCLMATCGTNMISSCIFQYDDPEDLKEFAVEERLELWGLQVRLRYPHLLGRVSVYIIRAGRMVGRCVNASTELPGACDSRRRSRKPGCMWPLFRSLNPINMICGAADNCRVLV